MEDSERKKYFLRLYDRDKSIGPYLVFGSKEEIYEFNEIKNFYDVKKADDFIRKFPNTLNHIPYLESIRIQSYNYTQLPSKMIDVDLNKYFPNYANDQKIMEKAKSYVIQMWKNHNKNKISISLGGSKLRNFEREQSKMDANTKAQNNKKNNLKKELNDAVQHIKKDFYPSNWGENDTIPLDEALKTNVPVQTCYVYKLTVGGSEYIDFSFDNPKISLQKHIKKAQDGSTEKIHIALRRFGYVNKIEILLEHNNEILGLLSQISAIEKSKPELNDTIGGEGNNYNIIEKKNSLGEKVFYVEQKLIVNEKKLIINRKKHLKLKKSEKYLSELKDKIFIRHQKITSRFEKWKYDYIEKDEINPILQSFFSLEKNEPNINLIKFTKKIRKDNKYDHFNNILMPENLSLNFTRKNVYSYFKSLSNIGKRLSDWDDIYYQRCNFYDLYKLSICFPTDELMVYSGIENKKIQTTLIENSRLFSRKFFPDGKRLIALRVGVHEIPEVSSIDEAIKFIKSTNWFQEGKKLKMFKLGDIFYPFFIECGTYCTGSFFNKKIEKNYSPIHIRYEQIRT